VSIIPECVILRWPNIALIVDEIIGARRPIHDFDSSMSGRTDPRIRPDKAIEEVIEAFIGSVSPNRITVDKEVVMCV